MTKALRDETRAEREVRESHRRRNFYAKALADPEAFDVETKYHQLLPNGLSTDLCIQLGLNPGRQVAKVQQVLAQMVLSGEVGADAPREELMAVCNRLTRGDGTD